MYGAKCSWHRHTTHKRYTHTKTKTHYTQPHVHNRCHTFTEKHTTYTRTITLEHTQTCTHTHTNTYTNTHTHTHGTLVNINERHRCPSGRTLARLYACTLIRRDVTQMMRIRTIQRQNVRKIQHFRLLWFSQLEVFTCCLRCRRCAAGYDVGCNLKLTFKYQLLTMRRCLARN